MDDPSEPPVLPDDLVAGWRAIMGWSDAGDRAMWDLASRYGEPHRHYHGVDHLVHVVRRVDELLESDSGPVPTEADEAIVLAAWFHDAVYDPRAVDNERRSADLARSSLGALGAPAPLIDAVDRLVMATLYHRPAGLDEAVLLDADLAVLGAHAPVYDAYVANVRAEYAHVTDAEWRVGRARVLRGFLLAPVFSTDAAAVDNARAAANLERELAGLIG